MTSEANITRITGSVRYPQSHGLLFAVANDQIRCEKWRVGDELEVGGETFQIEAILRVGDRRYDLTCAGPVLTLFSCE